MDQFDPYGDDDDQHGTTGRDICLIIIVFGLIGFVLSTLDQWPA